MIYENNKRMTLSGEWWVLLKKDIAAAAIPLCPPSQEWLFISYICTFLSTEKVIEGDKKLLLLMLSTQQDKPSYIAQMLDKVVLHSITAYIYSPSRNNVCDAIHQCPLCELAVVLFHQLICNCDPFQVCCTNTWLWSGVCLRWLVFSWLHWWDRSVIDANQIWDEGDPSLYSSQSELC